MKNIEKFNVIELNSNDAASINGGWWRYALSLAIWHWDNWDDIKEGFHSAK